MEPSATSTPLLSAAAASAVHQGCRCRCLARYLFVTMAFLGLMNVYMMRVNVRTAACTPRAPTHLLAPCTPPLLLSTQSCLRRRFGRRVASSTPPHVFAPHTFAPLAFAPLAPLDRPIHAHSFVGATPASLAPLSPRSRPRSRSSPWP